MKLSTLLAWLPTAALAVSFLLLVLDPVAQRCAGEVRAWRAHRDARLAAARGSPPLPPPPPPPPRDGRLWGRVVLGIFFGMVLTLALPVNVWLMANAFKWALAIGNDPLGELVLPAVAQPLPYDESHLFALLLSTSLLIFGSAWAETREARADRGGGLWCQLLLLSLLCALVLFEVAVAGLAGYHRSGEEGAEAWQLAAVGAWLGLLTSTAEIVAGTWLLHGCLLGLVRRLSDRPPRPRPAAVPSADAGPSWPIRLGAAVDAVIGPLRRLDDQVASLWRARVQRRGETS